MYESFQRDVRNLYFSLYNPINSPLELISFTTNLFSGDFKGLTTLKYGTVPGVYIISPEPSGQYWVLYLISIQVKMLHRSYGSLTKTYM